MAQQHQLIIADQRAVTPRLYWLTLHAPELARSVRAGQYLLVRCAEAGSYDPLLRRSLFIAAVEPALGQIGLLYAPDERGLIWLARGRAGDTLDVIGPLGHPFALDGRTRNLLLLGSGPELAALLLLARASTANGTVTLLAGADDEQLLPPAFLLPSEIEYQTIVGRAIDLLGSTETPPSAKAAKQKSSRKDSQAAAASPHPLTPSPLHPIAWADQICAALPNAQLLALRDRVQQVKYRWERGFASALLPGPIVCGVGACGVCAVELRHRMRMRCVDGPVVDLRDVGEN